MNDANDTEGQRRRIRRSAILLGLVALSFYVAFIVMSVMRS
ncbi:MAG: hypothetical protein ABI821_13545 [Pseudomonadota bacterium]